MEKRNVVLIVLDTMRKDYADKYIWPVLKKYGFVKYDRAVTTAPWTIPAHASMLTGLYPSQHEAHMNKNLEESKVKLKKKHRYIPKELKEIKGYKTYLITANTLVTPFFGFDEFDKVFDVSKVPFTFVERLDENDLEKIRKVLKKEGVTGESAIVKAFILIKTGNITLFLKALTALIKTLIHYTRILLYHAFGGHSWPKDKGVSDAINIISSLDFSKNTFLLINLMEVHEPYKFVFFYAGYNDKILNGKIDADLWKVRYKEFSEYLARKLDTLIQSILEKTEKDVLIIITSDHGQLFGENGFYGHGKLLLDELLFVPLYIFYPVPIDTKTTRKNDKWISCKNIYNLINSYVNRNLKTDDILYEDFALSELYGCTKKYNNKIVRTPCYKIAVYYKDYKGIFNVDEWKWECWKTYNEEEEVPEEAKEEMMKIVLKHLRTAAVKDRVKEKIKKLLPKKKASS